jgi:outer membrane protein OmpA-like peptidoglycan-associated protein
MKSGFGRYGAAALLLLVGTVGVTSGCATRRFVRNEVGTSANELSAKMAEKDAELQSGIESNSSQITELSGVTREHGQQISTLDSGLKATDGKATQAMTVGQGAQTTANDAIGQVRTLDEQFQGRNNYATLSEEAIPFKFGSATIDAEHTASLDQMAQRLKGDRNAILVLEGRTDNVGDETYNIQLGEKRLDAVVRYLVVEQGVALPQIYKMSFGEARPVAANDTREGRAQNRAVLLRLMGPNGSSNGQMVSDAAPMQ